MKEYLYKELYDLENKHWWFLGKKKIVLSLIRTYVKYNESNKILDAGCGSGLMLNNLKEFGKVFGMDCSKDAIKFSKLIFDGEVKLGFMPEHIPYIKNYFNLIIALDVIEHIEDDELALLDLKDHLTYDGVCVITVPACMSLWSNHDIVHQHKRRYTLRELKKKLLNAGLKVEKISYYNSILFLPIFIIRQIHRLLNIKSGSDAKMPNTFINFILKNVFSFERHILKNYSIPFGVSLIAIVKKA
ncbi:class I SAM-dependent methyltransferase [Clostridium fermenticellae]|uniref:Class I SAM-dependent methyltransferase n=1 Tax=Clostridium fermenticellae TaxID=2068654 RepID=A0A386H3Z2_9CLOT|nr:class I SAM-dependent methyltransferase [Clostridium fermenticellae]AYD40437.1 class I SAM-dependent methyltransferase [Clostridium fermenticellae]